ncbi:MAG: hypothetical protein ACRYFS_24740 [Janthinobacterium lividum]
MADKQSADNPKERFDFPGFGTSPEKDETDDGVFLLVISHEGSLTAAAYATEVGAMEAAFEYLEGEWDPGDERGSLDDRYLRAQEFLTNEGGTMEIISSPIYGA